MLRRVNAARGRAGCDQVLDSSADFPRLKFGIVCIRQGEERWAQSLKRDHLLQILTRLVRWFVSNTAQPT